MMSAKWRKIWAVLLMSAMILALMPNPEINDVDDVNVAKAADEWVTIDSEVEGEGDTGWVVQNGIITITENGNYQIATANWTHSFAVAMEVEAVIYMYGDSIITETGLPALSIGEGAKVTLQVYSVAGGGHPHYATTIQSKDNTGIYVPEGAELIIENSGPYWGGATLNAIGYTAGIGGGDERLGGNPNAGVINIRNTGSVEMNVVAAGEWGAGIGGGYATDAATTVNGGEINIVGSIVQVWASGSTDEDTKDNPGQAAAIGGGGGTKTHGNHSVITINSGGYVVQTNEVSQSGLGYGTGIGASFKGTSDIKIDNSKITSTGMSGNSAIGGGSAGDITITNSTIVAGNEGAGATIGTGVDTRWGGTIEITGSDVNVLNEGSGAAIGVGKGTDGSEGSIIIEDNTTFTATGGTKAAGIGASEGASIGEISIKNSEDKVMTVDGGSGIGGGTVGTINIDGGTINIGTTNNGVGAKGAGIGAGEGGKIDEIVISAGTIDVGSSGGGAAIGGGTDSEVGKITISGGDVDAWCGNGGSAIGAGDGGTVDEIIISEDTGEATIWAYTWTTGGGQKAAGIGGEAGKIAISGGNITAEGGADSAGIGSSDGCEAGEIHITGGTITASSGGGSGAGIGGGKGSNGGTITIDGGTIDALGKGAGAGIGSGGTVTGGSTEITINGGRITAQGGGSGAGIGTGGSSDEAIAITINGGTTRATATGQNDIGLGASSTTDGSEASLTINGGSVRAVNGGVIAPKNSAGLDVYRNTLTLNPSFPDSKVTSGVIDTIGCEQTANATLKVYGIRDVYTDSNSRLYLYLPMTNDSGTVEEEIKFKLMGITYSGSYLRGATTQMKTLVGPGTIDLSLNDLSAGGPGWTEMSGVITLASNSDYMIVNENATLTKYRIVVATGVTANVALVNVHMNMNGLADSAAFLLDGTGTTVNLVIMGTNILYGVTNHAALEVNAGTKITIDGPGSLNASTNSLGAGIGSATTKESGEITINGGTIYARGGSTSAGIGGGYRGSNGVVTINGGKVEARAATEAAGIGGGQNPSNNGITGHGGKITINGGEILAICEGGTGSGIGAGRFGDSGIIKINGGKIEARGMNDASGYAGAGIGGSRRVDEITITGGIIKIPTFNYGTGIGNGYVGGTGISTTGTINISGGNITIDSGNNYGAGIGCGYLNMLDKINISGGKITVYGKGNSAGIGTGGSSGGTMSTINEINIAGGEITAYGNNSAAIGGGTGGTAGHFGIINIYDGIIKAYGTGGAGIGGGTASQQQGTINISGGDITATSVSGAGIGYGLSAGSNSRIYINISGGKVRATGGSNLCSGIGLGNSADGNGVQVNVIISGGDIVASGPTDGSAGAGIGVQNQGSIVTITGGSVTAIGMVSCAGIGGRTGMQFQTRAEIMIDGGTVRAIANGDTGAAIGGGSVYEGVGEVRINGGSVYVNNLKGPRPRNNSNQNVYYNIWQVGRPAVANAQVLSGKIGNVDMAQAPAGNVYGIKDVYTDSVGQVYFWLRETAAEELVKVTAGKSVYGKAYTRVAFDINSQVLQAGAISVLMSPDDTKKKVGMEGTIDVSFENPYGLDGFAMALPFLFDNDKIEITDLETIDFDIKGLGSVVVNGTSLSDLTPYDSSTEVVSVINAAGKFLLSWAVLEGQSLPSVPHTVENQTPYFRIHYKVRDDSEFNVPFHIKEYSNLNGIQQDPLFGMGGSKGVISSNYGDYGAYVLATGYIESVTNEYVNLGVPTVEVMIFDEITDFEVTLRGRAVLTGKQRAYFADLNYTPDLQRMDAGIRVELYEVETDGTIIGRVEDIVYTQPMNMTGVMANKSLAVYNWEMRIPKELAEAIALSDPDTGAPKYMLRFSRYGSNGGDVGTVRQESYLWAEMYIDGTKMNVGGLTEASVLSINDIAYLYAGAFYLNSVNKYAITTADLNTIKGQVGNDNIEGITTIYNINEYLGVDAADYTTVLRYLGKTRMQPLPLVVTMY
ncbi:MAG: hypothetical protein LBL34_00745 [Clostridiales bacterium]|nr:hypothetical protein [Clostridiales bacterium]